MSGSVMRVRLTTRGRRSGRPHEVWITAVLYEGDYYFSRHRPDSDWFLNALENDEVVICTEDETIRGTPYEVCDESLVSTISNIKYRGQARAAEKRVAIRVVPYVM